MVVGVFVINNQLVSAEDEETVSVEDLIVINPNSKGEPVDVYDIEEKDEEGNVLTVSKKQFTKSRDITILISISDEDLNGYQETFTVCEIIPGSSKDTEKCANYSKNEKKIYFQISGKNDGEKEIKINFSGSSNLTINKKIILDTIGPSITLNGGNYMYIPLGGRYEEKNATCTDDSGVVLGDCAVTVEEANIDMNKATYQYVRYTAVDFLGNETNAVRKVLVEIEVEGEDNTVFWIGAGFGIAVLSALLFLQVWKNKEKQKNQSVL